MKSRSQEGQLINILRLAFLTFACKGKNIEGILYFIPGFPMSLFKKTTGISIGRKCWIFTFPKKRATGFAIFYFQIAYAFIEFTFVN